MMIIELNEYGQAIWRHRTNKLLFAERSYRWCDRIVTIDETEDRRIVADNQFSSFDLSDWIPVTMEEFAKIKNNYKEVWEL